MLPQSSDIQFQLWGTVTDVAPGLLKIAGVSTLVGIGNEITINKSGSQIFGEILHVGSDLVTASLFSEAGEVRVGDRVEISHESNVKIGDDWLGQIVNYRGEVSSRENLKSIATQTKRHLIDKPPPAHLRRALGQRLSTGLMVTDTLLPICEGQRIGLFAGSGVGKSTLLGALAKHIEVDRVVVGLIGERSREVNEFAQRIFSPEVAERTVIVAATASEPPGAKKRAAYCAMAAAEHFRDEGHRVLLIMDSITRFAEAHREVALLGGETPALNAFPPSTVRVIAELAERSGPGTGQAGDITAIFSVLVAGSDMEEPVADMIRGILDGHIILSRDIAERGRYPAIDVLKSVSRSLPDAATQAENDLLRDYRQTVALYEEVAPMVRASLYEFGNDAASDRAINLFSKLDNYVASENESDIEYAFTTMNNILEASTPTSSEQVTEK